MTPRLKKWVEGQPRLFEPKHVYWCDGSEGEARRLIERGMREEKIGRNDIFRPLNQAVWPKSYLHRSHPTDVARTEQLTFVCPSERDAAGPNNNWKSPKDAKELMTKLSRGAMRGKTMYVQRYIMHFPEEGLVWSIGSGYGGNALLGKKCFALRIASYLGLKQGWLAEHMVIMGIEDIHSKVTYITAAMPSACGKTNLAMLESALPEYRVWA